MAGIAQGSSAARQDGVTGRNIRRSTWPQLSPRVLPSSACPLAALRQSPEAPLAWARPPMNQSTPWTFPHQTTLYFSALACTTPVTSAPTSSAAQASACGALASTGASGCSAVPVPCPPRSISTNSSVARIFITSSKTNSDLFALDCKKHVEI